MHAWIHTYEFATTNHIQDKDGSYFRGVGGWMFQFEDAIFLVYAIQL